MLFRVKNPLFTTNFVTVKCVTRSAGAFVDTTTSIRLRNVGRSVCLDRVVYSLHSQEVVAKPLLQSAPPRGGTRDDFSKVAHSYKPTLAHFLKAAPAELRPKGTYSSSLLDLPTCQADDAGLPCLFASPPPFSSGTAALAPLAYRIGPLPFLPNPHLHPNRLSKPLSSRRHSPKRADLSTQFPGQLTLLSLPLFPSKPFSRQTCLSAAAAFPPFILSYPIVSYHICPLPTLAHSPKQQTTWHRGYSRPRLDLTARSTSSRRHSGQWRLTLCTLACKPLWHCSLPTRLIIHIDYLQAHQANLSPLSKAGGAHFVCSALST